MATTWNPADKTAGVTLSGGNNVATASTVSQGVRATNPFTAKTYCETASSAPNSGAHVVANAAFNFTPGGGVGQAYFLLSISGTVSLYNNSFGVVASWSGSLAANDVIGWAIDGTRLDITQNGVSRVVNATIASDTYYPSAVWDGSASAAVTLQADTTTYSPPSGYTIIGGGGPANPPSNTSVPTLSDTSPVVGQVITAGVGAWTESPTSYAYRWFLDGSVISGETDSTYTGQAADAGKALSVGVIATNGIGSSSEAVSADSSPIAHTWQLVGVAVSALQASGNYTLTLPSGSQSGDVVVAAIAMRSNVGFTVPAGWTQANQDTGGNTTNNTTASDTSSTLAYIIRGGSAPSMVFTRTGGSRALGVVAVYRYTDQSAPPTFDTSVLTPLGAAATAISGTGLTTGAAGELIVGAVFGARNISVSNFRATDPATGSGATDTTSNPADGAWTERADTSNATSPTVGIFLADAVRTTAGATGSLLATASASALHAIGAMAFAPPAGGGTITSASAQSAGASSASGLGAATNAQRAVSASASAAVGGGASVVASEARSLSGAQAAAQGGAILSAVAQASSASAISATGAQVAAAAGQSASISSALGAGASTVAAAALSNAASSTRAGQASLASTAGASISGAAASGNGASTAASQAISAGSSRAEGRGASLAAFQASSISVSSALASTSPVILVSAAGVSTGVSAAQAGGALIAARSGQSLAASVAAGASTAIAARDAGCASNALVEAQSSAIAQAAAASLAVSAVAGQWSALSRAVAFAQSVGLGWAGQGAIVSVTARADGLALASGYGRAIVFAVDTPANRTFRVAPDVRIAVPALQSRTVQAAAQSRTIIAKG